MLTSKQSSQASGCRVTGLGRSLLFISQFFLAGVVSATDLISFESEVPQQITLGGGSTYELVSSKAIHGDQSLQWGWDSSGASIEINYFLSVTSDTEARKVLGRPATHVLSFWVYNEHAIEKSKPLKVLVNGNTNASVDVSLDFTGWRTFGVSIINDLNFEGATIDSLVFKAPAVEKGSLLIDRVMFSIDDSRYQWSDYHVKTSKPYQEIDFGVAKDVPLASDKYNNIDTIRKRVIEYLTSSNPDSLDDIKKRYGTFKRRDKDVLRHVITDPQMVIYQPSALSDGDRNFFEQYAVLGDSAGEGIKAAGYAKLMLDIGEAYQKSESQADKDELSKIYIEMTRHLLEQGFYEGSALVTTHHWGYSGRWWYLSALLMADADVLKDTDALDEKKESLRAEVYNALVWYSREFKESFDMVTGPESSNLDYLNTLSIQHLALLLLEPDADRRVALVEKYSEFIGESLAQTPPGYNDGFRPDGTAWRHKGNYPGYSFAAMDNAAKVVYFLSDTPFAVSDEGRASLKKAMMAGWLYTNPFVGLGNSGRHPFDGPGIKVYDDGIKYLALSGNPETGDSVDEELASVYLQVTGKSEQDSQAIFKRSIKPATLPEGHWSFNGGAFGIHRYKDIMVTLKAYNSNVWSSEIYAKDNRYGRYQSHGAVQIMPYGDLAAAGYKEDGWNWNRNPGTTTINLDWETLESPRSGTSLMLFSDEAFSGSASLDNEFGLFAFKHQAPDEDEFKDSFDSTFVARKSVMAIGNRLIMLGSDIFNSSSTNTETTLFQHAISESDPTIINGSEITGLTDASDEFGKGDWLIDGMGNGYLVASDSTVKVARKTQSSPNNKTKIEKSGEFATAWINHGAAPKGADYEYQVVLKTTPDQMSALAANLRQGDTGYKVLRKDEQFHVVQDLDSGVTGYVAFERGETEVSDSLITYINQPALAMVRTLDNGRLSLTAVSPSLNIAGENQAHQPVDVTVTLDGIWELSEKTYQGVQLSKLSNTTEVTFTSDFGQSSSIELKPEGDESVDPTPPSDGGGDGGGGSLEWMTLLILLSALFLRKQVG